jgi:hypothetical protein
MFFWTGLCPEIHAVIQKCKDYLTFDAYIKAGVKAEIVHCLDAEYNKVFRSTSKDRALEKAGKCKGKLHHNLLDSCLMQDALQHSCGSSHSRGPSSTFRLSTTRECKEQS